MADMTPPSSLQGTPVRQIRRRTAADNLVDLREPDNNGESRLDIPDLRSSPPRDLEDEVRDYQHRLDQTEEIGAKTDESDSGSGSDTTDEGMDEDSIPIEPVVAPESEAGAKNTESSSDATKKEIPTDQRAESKLSGASRSSKGKKKDNDLVDSDIVARWNREIGDIFAIPATSTKA